MYPCQVASIALADTEPPGAWQHSLAGDAEMPNWVLTIADAEPPAAGIYRAMQKYQSKVVAHEFQPSRQRDGGWGFFVYTGAGASRAGYPHVTVMLDSPLHQKAGLLFFGSHTFHVSKSDSAKLFYTVVRGRFAIEPGQGSLLGLDEMKAMGTTFINLVRSDITAGISPTSLAQGRSDLGPEDSYGKPIWEREALERQELESDQFRLRQIVARQDEEYYAQFEQPDDF
jgi:hypothetical protein